MTNSLRSPLPTPVFVIDTCPSDDTQEPLRPLKPPVFTPCRSWSLPNCNETYKDLDGSVHHSFHRRLTQFLQRSRSYPNNHLALYSKANELLFRTPLSLAPTSLHVNYLDPHGGMQTPGGASSRYSLYGSIFDLSESGFYPPSDHPLTKSDQRVLTIGGRPLLIVDQSSRAGANAFEDKCARWLHHLPTGSS